MAILSSDTKIPIRDIAYIIGFTWFLGSIKSDISELRLRIDGRLTMFEYRLTQVEHGSGNAARPDISQKNAILPVPPSRKHEDE